MKLTTKIEILTYLVRLLIKLACLLANKQVLLQETAYSEAQVFVFPVGYIFKIKRLSGVLYVLYLPLIYLLPCKITFTFNFLILILFQIQTKFKCFPAALKESLIVSLASLIDLWRCISSVVVASLATGFETQYICRQKSCCFKNQLHIE